MTAKKKKTLIIVLVVCFAVAAGALTGALLLKRSAPAADSKPANQSTAASSGGAQTSAAGEEYVDDAHKEEYEKISSTNIKGEPDTKIKATFFEKVKKATPDAEVESFDLLKTYDAFRIYDTVGTTKENGKENFVLLVYTEKDSAKMVWYEVYKTAEERAEILTNAIKELDADYERLVVECKKLDNEYILYEAID